MFSRVTLLVLLLAVSVVLFGCPSGGGGGGGGGDGEDERQRVLGRWDATSVLYGNAPPLMTLGEVVFSEDGVARWYTPSMAEDVAPEILDWSENSGVIRVTGTNEYLLDEDIGRVVRSTTLTFEGPNVMTGETLMSLWLNGSFVETVDGTEELTRSDEAQGEAENEGEVETPVEGEGEVPIGPTVQFYAQPRSGAAPLTVSFADDSLPGSSPITSRLWNFGDGSTSVAASVNHTYETPGVYDVSLTVATNVGSDTWLAADLITVESELWGTWDIRLTINVEGSPFHDYETHFFRFNEDNTVVWQVAGREAVAEYTEENLLVRIDDDFVFSPGTPDEELYASANFLMTYTPRTYTLDTISGSFSYTDSAGTAFTGTLSGWKL